MPYQLSMPPSESSMPSSPAIRPRRQSSSSWGSMGPVHRAASSSRMASSARAALPGSMPLETVMLPVKLWNEDEQTVGGI